MDGDFQSKYLSAEQAYAAGEFQTARSTVLDLLDQLEPLPDSSNERNATLAWRSFVALLAGHIHLYGLNQTHEAQSYYKLVLTSNPQDTLRELAEQGLERSRKDQTVVLKPETTTSALATPVTEAPQTAGSAGLVRDPFLKTSAVSSQPDQPETASASAATPWLKESPPDQPAITTAVITPAAIEHEMLLNTEVDVSIIEDSAEDSETIQVLGIPAEESSPQELGAIDLPQSKFQEDPLIQQALKQRLEAGMLRVKLPDQPETPGPTDTSSNSATSKWSWLLAALRRS